MIITFPRFVLATKNRKKQDGRDKAVGQEEEGAAVCQGHCSFEWQPICNQMGWDDNSGYRQDGAEAKLHERAEAVQLSRAVFPALFWTEEAGLARFHKSVGSCSQPTHQHTHDFTLRFPSQKCQELAELTG